MCRSLTLSHFIDAELSVRPVAVLFNKFTHHDSAQLNGFPCSPII